MFNSFFNNVDLSFVIFMKYFSALKKKKSLLCVNSILGITSLSGAADYVPEQCHLCVCISMSGVRLLAE